MSTLAVDALPVALENKFLSMMYVKSDFWGDMMTLCIKFGLRNSECRNMKVTEINLDAGTLTLNDSKGQKAHVTKTANKAVNDLWITQAQIFLYETAIDKGDTIRAASADLLDSETSLAKLSIKLRVEDEYQSEKLKHYQDNIQEQRAIAKKTAPKGRVIDFNRCTGAKKILIKRINNATNSGAEFLFPTNELSGSRAQAKGFEPVTRQAVYSCIKSVRNAIDDLGGKFSKALKGVRVSLHSMRKMAVQKVADVMGDILAASIWIGHGSGAGDLATTQRYLNKSSARMDEINLKLSNMNG